MTVNLGVLLSICFEGHAHKYVFHCFQEMSLWGGASSPATWGRKQNAMPPLCRYHLPLCSNIWWWQTTRIMARWWHPLMPPEEEINSNGEEEEGYSCRRVLPTLFCFTLLDCFYKAYKLSNAYFLLLPGEKQSGTSPSVRCPTHWDWWQGQPCGGSQARKWLQQGKREGCVLCFIGKGLDQG